MIIQPGAKNERVDAGGPFVVVTEAEDGLLAFVEAEGWVRAGGIVVLREVAAGGFVELHQEEEAVLRRGLGFHIQREAARGDVFVAPLAGVEAILAAKAVVKIIEGAVLRAAFRPGAAAEIFR